MVVDGISVISEQQPLGVVVVRTPILPALGAQKPRSLRLAVVATPGGPLPPTSIVVWHLRISGDAARFSCAKKEKKGQIK